MPDKHIELIFGSNNNHVIGRAIFGNLTDEANFGVGNNVERLKAKTKKLVSQIDARMQSRFMKGTYLPTLNIIASSKQSDQAFLESYIELKKRNESKTTMIIDQPQWIIRNDKGSVDDPNCFYVAVGNKFLASELIPLHPSDEILKAYQDKGYTLLKVPPGYYENFKDDIDVALTDIAGISTAESLKFISGARLKDSKILDYKNPFTKDVIEVGNAKDDRAQYYNFFDLSVIPEALKSKPLYIHLDMSITGDKTGIAGTWILGKRPHQEGIDSAKEMLYRLAFSVSIKAPKGYQISFEKNRTFIRWLRDQGFRIKLISSDTFQSATILQQLQADGFETQVLSVDRVDAQSRTCLPYQFLKSAIYERLVQIYDDCPLLTDELLDLERKSDGHTDHPINGSKDQADAFCGSLYIASQHAEEFAFDYGENLDSMTQANNVVTSSEAQKKQIQVEFEQEMIKLLDPISRIQQREQQEQQSQPTPSQPTGNNTETNDFRNLNYNKFGQQPNAYKPNFIQQGIILW